MAKKTTKAPSGLTISRDGSKFYFSWKVGEKYSSQALQYRYHTTKWSKWTGITVKAGSTSASVTLDNITDVQFRVKGDTKKKKASGWSSKGYTIWAPNNPSVSASLVTASSTNFSWSTDVDNRTVRHFVKHRWESVLVENSNTGNGASVSWSKVSNYGEPTAASGSWLAQESGWSKSEYSYTRWFRVRALGWRGKDTGWIYARHVYAIPERAKNVSATRSPLPGGGFTVTASWDSPWSEAKPIDSTTVQYVKAIPRVEVVYPDANTGEVQMDLSCPETGINWASLADVAGNPGKRGIAFTDATDLDNDQCLFLRVNNRHDNETKEGMPVLVGDGLGKILPPSVPTVSAGGVDRLYTVSVSRNTAIINAAIAVYFRYSSEPNKNVIIGIIQPGESTTDCIIPEFPEGDSISFGVQAFVGNYVPWKATSDSQPTYFEIKNLSSGARMTSNIVWGEGVPLPPSNVAVVKVNDSTVQVGWNWSWRDATQAELSWADHDDAWESTDEPQTYIINNTNAGRWNIAGLSVGTWYIRVRLLRTIGDSVTFGAYSPTQTIKLSSSPDTPSLVLSSGVIPKDGTVTCYWAYVSTDGTAQQQGEVCEAFPEYSEVENPDGSPYEQMYYERIRRDDTSEDEYIYTRSFDSTVDPEKTYYRSTGNITYGKPIRSTNTAQHITLGAEEFGWLPGETHHLAVRVMSMSGEASEGWSAPVPVTIANEITAEITQTSLITETLPIDEPEQEGDPETRTVTSLVALPLTATSTGAGIGGSTTWIIERSESYHLDRPDESEYEGFAGETVFMRSQNGGDSISIDQGDLIGMLDDGASYRLIAIVMDSYGQSDTASVDFEVHWSHQAVMPSATIEKDDTNHITMITPIQPDGWAEGDVVDIYRLSVDKPELIVSNAVFGTKYVDPYPAFGEFGGHRIVYKTVNGDYITADNQGAWVDYTADENEAYKHDLFGVVIDFDGNQLILPYNVSFNSSWAKDFTITKYLGGSIQGDFNPAVERSDSANVTIPIEIEPDNVELLRRLAVYPGLCHVRMPDGSSFTANVEVKDNREEKWTTRISKASLEIKACSSNSEDGMTYAEWIADQPEE